MNNKQQIAKGPRDLFRGIDALCNEVDSAPSNKNFQQAGCPICKQLDIRIKKHIRVILKRIGHEF